MRSSHDFLIYKPMRLGAVRDAASWCGAVQARQVRGRPDFIAEL